MCISGTVWTKAIAPKQSASVLDPKTFRVTGKEAACQFNWDQTVPNFRIYAKESKMSRPQMEPKYRETYLISMSLEEDLFDGSCPPTRRQVWEEQLNLQQRSDWVATSQQSENDDARCQSFGEALAGCLSEYGGFQKPGALR